jgi:7,8-dihydropterin-6-yl-methyl-4-(beta-D-ribofuranosyl)aminobenzene 5'-phosphate synthase
MSWRMLLIVAVMPALAAQNAAPSRVRSLKITVLSTMLADTGIGEWGFAALVEADGRRLLFDTGARPNTVSLNARELKVDLSGVDAVVLSHHHNDHTGGLVTLRRETAARRPEALRTAHVGRGIFFERVGGRPVSADVPRTKADYEAAGGRFVEHEGPVELWPGVWLTGPVPRVHPERNWSQPSDRVRTPAKIVEDNLPEDQALVADTERGLVVVAGCGHAGIVNTLEHARKVVRGAPVHAVVGGLHLLDADDAKLVWTGGKLREFGVQHLLAAHCTGIEATFRLRELLRLTRATAVVAAVGSSFSLEHGIDPLRLAR